MAENSLQELGTAIVRDRGAEVARQEPDSDDDGNDDGDDADDDGVVGADNEPLYDGVDGYWVNKLVKGGLGDHNDDLDLVADDGICFSIVGLYNY